jgi:hypothetical protein
MSLKLGGLHEKHAVATWNLGTISAFTLRRRKTKKTCVEMAFNLIQKFVQMIFKDTVRTSKRTSHFTITRINWLTLFKPFEAEARLNNI